MSKEKKKHKIWPLKVYSNLKIHISEVVKRTGEIFRIEHKNNHQNRDVASIICSAYFMIESETIFCTNFFGQFYYLSFLNCSVKKKKKKKEEEESLTDVF